MVEQKQSGLGGRPQFDALGKFRMAVMPDKKSKSLSEILEEMPDKERNSIKPYAKMILRMRLRLTQVHTTSKLKGCIQG